MDVKTNESNPLWLVSKKHDISGTTVASFRTKQEAEQWAERWLGEYTITYFEEDLAHNLDDNMRASKSSKRINPKIKSPLRRIEMDKKIIGAEKHIQKVEKKEFKSLLKEDHKLDAKRDKLEKEVAKKKK